MGFLVFLALLAYFNSMSRCCLLKCTLRRSQEPLAFGGKERETESVGGYGKRVVRRSGNDSIVSRTNIFVCNLYVSRCRRKKK